MRHSCGGQFRGGGLGGAVGDGSCHSECGGHGRDVDNAATAVGRHLGRRRGGEEEDPADSEAERRSNEATSCSVRTGAKPLVMLGMALALTATRTPATAATCCPA